MNNKQRKRHAALVARRKKLDKKRQENRPIALNPSTRLPHVLESDVPVAEYKCLACSLEFIGAPAPAICPGCKHIYVRWTNYDGTNQNNKD